jgi:PAS domain S-box-containing protein
MSVDQKSAKKAPKERSGEAAFQMESCLWERAFDSVPDLLAIIDCHHRFVRVNQPMAGKLGRTPEQCVGLKCHECVHGASEPPATCPRALALVDGKSHASEVHDDRLGGWFLVTASPLRDESGQVVGSVHVARDINEQKKAVEILRRLLEAGDHERHLMSCEIHDGLAQQLACALMQFEAYDCLKEKEPEEAAKTLELGIRLVRDSHAEVRRLVGGLRPPQLAEGGVLAAIESLVEEYEKRIKVKIEFRPDVERLKLPPMLENTVFRIVQECLNNACHHSKSEKVKVELTQHDDRLRVEIRDWGIGFEPERVGEGHFGLEGIRERAKVCGGHAVVKSSLGKGTEVVVQLPLPTGCR